MNRRQMMVLFGGAALVRPHAAPAQQAVKLPIIGF